MIFNNKFTSLFYKHTSVLFMVSSVLLTSCQDDVPVKEDTPELITKATLTFTPSGGGTAVVATATDPDGEGVQDISVDGPINLKVGLSYVLEITLVNGLADPASQAYDITAEVKEESDEHMFFFGWTNNVFSTPAGDGNIDKREDVVTYDDSDDNGLPIGLSTTWITAPAIVSGEFHVLLKHQPDLKSTTSTSSDGESDLDVQFAINVQ